MKKSDFDITIEPVLKAIEEFPWGDRDHYAQYLAQTYYYVRHSTRLLAAAAARFSHEDELLHQRFMKHGTEERGHHAMAQKDLERLGYSLKDFEEISATSFLYQPQYYKAHYEDPTAFFGYILALEGVAAQKARWMYAEATKHYEKNCCVFLMVHGEEDVGHIEKAFEMVSQISAEKQPAIWQNLRQSTRAIENLLSEIPRQQKNKLSAAA